MISVPNEIKELLLQDTCYKNIRIVFPHGERTDICNDLIVMDSVSFKESLCSQDTLKFGLCEAPVFECEVVGVGNISGMTIRVYCEVYCDASVSGAVWKNDLQHHIYQIPYGTFVVNSAERQSDIIHRKIVAYRYMNIYDQEISDAVLYGAYTANTNPSWYVKEHNNYENIKNLAPRKGSGTYSFDALKRMFDRYPKIPESLVSLSDLGVTTTSYYTEDAFDNSDMKLKTYYHCYTLGNSTNQTLYRIKYEQPLLTKDQAYNEITDEGWGDPLGMTRKVVYEENPAYFTVWSSEATFLNHPMAHYNGMIRTQVYLSGSAHAYADMAFDRDIWLYPYNATSDASSNTGTTITICVPYKIVLGEQRGIDWYPTEEAILHTGDGFKVYSVSSDLFGHFMDTEGRKKTTFYNVTGYIPKGTFNYSAYQDLITAMFEVKGLFGYLDRYETWQVLNIKQQFNLLPNTNVYPNNWQYPGGSIGGKLLPGDYQSCWYEDYYTLPFGVVKTQYKNSGDNEIYESILYLPGFSALSDPNTYQVYDLSDNEIIKNGTWSSGEIAVVLNTVANNIQGVAYMPAKIVSRGLPYVEPGDTFEVLTATNDSITTIVLNRTIKGERVLTDNYESV